MIIEYDGMVSIFDAMFMIPVSNMQFLLMSTIEGDPSRVARVRM